MGILSRYVFREFLSPLFYCLVGFVSIYVLFDLFGSFSRMLEARLPIADAALLKLEAAFIWLTNLCSRCPRAENGPDQPQNPVRY